MRVATRRMRAAWRVFGSAYRHGRARRMSGHLRIVGTRLGAVRDMDVLIDGLKAYASTVAPGDRDGIAPLIAAWEIERDDARILLVRELDSVAYRQWANAYGHFVVTEGLGALPPLSPVAPARVREMAGSRLWKAFEEMRAYESSLRWADLATLHQLRIAAKRLRYAVEFFREALGADTTVVLPRIVALQDHLGALHDAEVASMRARTFLVESSGQLTEARSRRSAATSRAGSARWRGCAGPRAGRGAACRACRSGGPSPGRSRSSDGATALRSRPTARHRLASRTSVEPRAAPPRAAAARRATRRRRASGDDDALAEALVGRPRDVHAVAVEDRLDDRHPGREDAGSLGRDAEARADVRRGRREEHRLDVAQPLRASAGRPRGRRRRPSRGWTRCRRRR